MRGGITGGIWEKNQEAHSMRILKEDCAGMVIDVQEKIFGVMDQKQQMLNRTLILVEGLKALSVPVLITEQYPKGLGKTLDVVSQAVAPESPVQKMVFSCCDEPVLFARLKSLKRSRVILCGIEAHVCVLQTVIDLIEKGYTPVVVADCTTSRTPDDKAVALRRMRDEGALVTTSESILFELVRESGTDLFKTISRLVK